MVNQWTIIFVILFSASMSLFHFFNDKFSNIIEINHEKILSFSGGTLIGLVFLVILPEVIKEEPNIYLYPTIMLGYIFFFISEKYVYQHVTNKKDLLVELKELHLIGFFTDHFIMGIFLVTILELEPVIGLISLIPIFLHIVSSTITLNHIHEFSETSLEKIILSSSVTLGTLFAVILRISTDIQRYFLAFILGILIFVVNRDVLPKEGEGDSRLFLVGITIVFLIWVLLEILIV